jgi:hypothetical protein
MVFGLASVSDAATSAEKWQCTFDVGGGGPPITEDFVEVAPNKLGAHLNDLTSELTLFEIVENSEAGLIAIQHYSESPGAGKPVQTGMVVVTIDKISGQFRMLGLRTNSSDAEPSNGTCRRL